MQINRSRFDSGGCKGGGRKMSALVRDVLAGHLREGLGEVECEHVLSL